MATSVKKKKAAAANKATLTRKTTVRKKKVRRQCQKTYVGVTVKFYRRIHQHNNTKAGAKRTRGRVWYPAFIVSGFKSKGHCLRFEKHMHLLSTPRVWNKRIMPKYRYGFNVIEKRIIAIKKLLKYGFDSNTVKGRIPKLGSTAAGLKRSEYGYLSCYIYCFDEMVALRERLQTMWDGIIM